MFPFNYIPDSIDPFMRKIIITLICVQFFSFLFLVIYLSYLHFTGKDKLEYEEIKKMEKEKEKNKNNSSNLDNNNNNEKENENEKKEEKVEQKKRKKD